MLREFDLTGRKAIITGAARGIGRGIALVLAEAGADVGVTALSEANAAKVAAEIQALGRRGFGWAADGTKVDTMQDLAKKALAQMGSVDILINCLGDSIPGLVTPLPGSTRRALTESDWHKVVDVNLTQAFVGCHVFGPILIEKKGCVINISSFAAVRPAANMSAYAASKAGLTMFTQSVALEWAPFGVRVNAIAPGSFPDIDLMPPDERQKRLEQGDPTNPLKRFGHVREVGLLAAYLASDAAAYVTGQTICIDGGRTL
ncbi:MAG: SDR family oxidoreductase [Dehalococcoidia bacterium]|nr:SDR family oxidoreductase [Dehalococcoidia bacterium]